MSDPTAHSASAKTGGGELCWPLALALVLLATHLFLATRNWNSGFLIGHEFRQTQTALSAHFIEITGYYGLDYPTPLFGPPWSAPLEFPLYQWCVAALTTLTGWPIAVSGRAVSLACFYLTLPAIFLLLRTLGIARPRIWLAMAVVLAAPVHIFYARAVLIESMALAFSAWFVVAYLRAVRDHQAVWVLVAMLAGAGASLVKVTTLVAWMVGAAVWTLWLLWTISRQDSPLEERIRSAARTSLWGLACFAPATLAGMAWLRFADRVKDGSPGGAWLNSGSMTDYTFGTWLDRVDPRIFEGLAAHIEKGITPWWSIALVVLAAALTRNWAWRVALGLLAWFAAAPVIFPKLYSAHDYYFVANATLFAAALGLCAGAWLDHRRRWLAPAVVAVLLCGQLTAYFRHYGPLQAVISNGGSGLTNFLRDMTPPDSVLIIVGDDWQPVIPFYAKRRAVMLRDDYLGDEAYLTRVLASLRREDVVAFIAVGAQRDNVPLRTRITTQLGIDPQLAVSSPEADVYLAHRHFHRVMTRLIKYQNYSYLTLRAEPGPPPVDTTPPLIHDGEVHEVTPRQARHFFPGVSPRPSRYRSKIGIGPGDHDGKLVLGAHPDSEIWIKVPSQAREVEISFGLPAATYLREGDKTDGVRFEVLGITPSGDAAALFDRLLSPATNEADRGEQTAVLRFPLDTTTLIFRTSPHDNYSYDWAYWSRIFVR